MIVLAITLIPHSLSITLLGSSFWALGLYLGWSKWADDLVDWGSQRLPAALASVLSVVPFVLLAIALEWAWESYLGRNWAVSFGILMCFGSGILRLGRQDQ